MLCPLPAVFPQLLPSLPLLYPDITFPGRVLGAMHKMSLGSLPSVLLAAYPRLYSSITLLPPDKILMLIFAYCVFSSPNVRSGWAGALSLFFDKYLLIQTAIE
jgi:hypothetical protein